MIKPKKLDKTSKSSNINNTFLYTKPDGKYRSKVFNIVSSVYFDAGILFLILLDVICFAWNDAELEFWTQQVLYNILIL
jgi:hypothetical protein